jgi:dipeptidyl aminopeptidase/acylaminoacyl peptidase
MAAARPFLAPLLSLAGLMAVGLLTVAVLGSVPLVPTGGTGGERPGNGGPNVPGRTPSPSAPPVVNPAIGIDGKLVYAKAGNLWIQEGTTSRQLTDTGRDSQPAWSPDGEWVYYIDTRRRESKFPRDGVVQTYDLRYPVLTRVRPDGGEREAILSGLYRTGPDDLYAWAFFIRDPAVAPNGATVAVVSDGPDPTKSNVVMARISVSGKRLRPMGLAESPPYGHQDPAWSPDGTQLAYVRNARQSGRGAPSIWRYDLAKEKATRLSSVGYTEPSYSPDGRLLVATKTTSLGTNIVVLDARNGNELLRVTRDGRSWGGAWSPGGTQVAFLRLEGSTTDLSIATVRETPGGPLAVGDIEPLTEFSGLDADSRPAWWGPHPEPAATPDATVTPAP